MLYLAFGSVCLTTVSSHCLAVWWTDLYLTDCKYFNTLLEQLVFLWSAYVLSLLRVLAVHATLKYICSSLKLAFIQILIHFLIWHIKRFSVIKCVFISQIITFYPNFCVIIISREWRLDSDYYKLNLIVTKNVLSDYLDIPG